MADLIKAIFTRIDSSANWKTLNPVPKNGEQCIEVLNGGLFKLKVGDGVTPWVALKYWTSDINGSSSINQTILNISEKYPSESGYYDLQTAIQTLKFTDILPGMVIMFQSSENVWETWQLNSNKKSAYQNIDHWARLSQSINYIIFNNTEEGEIENGSMITDISVEGNEETEDYYQLMTLTYVAKDVITGYNKVDKIILRSSDKSIIGAWDPETEVLDLNVSQDFIDEIQAKLDEKVDKSFADATDGKIEGATIIDSTGMDNGIRIQTTLIDVSDGSTSTKTIEVVSDQSTIDLGCETIDDTTNIDINVNSDNLLIDLGQF